MTGLLSLPPELLLEIIQICAQRDRCHLRSTCKTLNELAESIVFRSLKLHFRDPLVTEHQIIALATRSSKACEFARSLMIYLIPGRVHTSKQSLPYFGHCGDLRVHLPSAISALRNLTYFSCEASDHDPGWLVNSVMHAISRLSQLTELRVGTLYASNARIPYGLFANLSKLSAGCPRFGDIDFFLSETASAIANSPQLRSLNVLYVCPPRSVPLLTLNELFANLPTENPLCLEHLHVCDANAALDQVTLKRLPQLTSFWFDSWDISNARTVWTSFLVNNVKLTDVEIGYYAVTEESMWYLASFSGLKRLFLEATLLSRDSTITNLLYSEALPKHVNSLEILQLLGDSDTGWVFDHDSSKSIMKCHKLRDLSVSVDNSMPVQLVLDSVAHLPELKILRANTTRILHWEEELVNFEPSPGLRYVEELEIDSTLYVLEKDGGQPVSYREI